jgi:hypothetical protein
MDIHAVRDAEIRRFVRETYGLLGTLGLHRRAVGLDLLRAPANVALAPPYLLLRLLVLILRRVGLRGLAARLGRVQLFLPTRVSGEVAARLHNLLDRLDAAGAGVAAPPEVRHRAVQDYVAIRAAVAEITTSLTVLFVGFVVFHAATPGIASLAPSVADRLAQIEAARGFWAGERLGQAYYGLFPASASAGEIMTVAFALALIASVVTTFAGVLADPVQKAMGAHRRRLHRLIARLDASGDAESLAPEHLLARTGDLTDALFAIIRALRG